MADKTDNQRYPCISVGVNCIFDEATKEAEEEIEKGEFKITDVDWGDFIKANSDRKKHMTREEFISLYCGTLSVEDYQSMKVLFVCSQGKIRSKTAAHCIGGIDASYCGIDEDADVKIEESYVVSADVVVCMEEEHKRYVSENFGRQDSLVWNIPDEFDYMDDELVFTLRRKAETTGVV